MTLVMSFIHSFRDFGGKDRTGDVKSTRLIWLHAVGSAACKQLPVRPAGRVVVTLYILHIGQKGFPLSCNTKVVPRKILDYGLQTFVPGPDTSMSPTLHSGFLCRSPRALK